MDGRETTSWPGRMAGALAGTAVRSGLLLLSCLLVWSAAPGASQASSSLKEKISRQKEKIQAEKESLVRLTKREKRLYSDLAKVEKRISALQEELAEERRALEEVKERKRGLEGRKQRMESAYAANRAELKKLLERLWPLYLRNSSISFAAFDSWEEAERRFTWLASIYRLAEEKGRRLAQQQEEIRDLLIRQEQVSSELKERVRRIQSKKEKLLEDKLLFLHQVQKVRAKRLLKEEQLARVNKTIEDLEYKLKIRTTHQITKLKGYLPYPVKGDIVLHYSAEADPPREGVGFSLASEAQVQAVSWGKVVYNDTLRGFGRVVIIYHGQQYYSLYAYLGRSQVTVGQDVEKGETIGRAGFYPQVQTSGLYFELRRGKKNLNPEAWFGSRG